MGKPTKVTISDIRRYHGLDSVGVDYSRDESFTLPAPAELEKTLRDRSINQSQSKARSIIVKQAKRVSSPVRKIQNIHRGWQNRAKRKSKLLKPNSLSQLSKATQNFKKLKSLAPIIIFLFIVFVGYRGIWAKAKAARLTDDAKSNLETAFDQINRGQTADALISADKAREDIGSLKLLAQSWGQDIQLLSYMPRGGSKLVAYERFLDSAYEVLNTLSLFQDALKSAVSRGAITRQADSGVPSINLVLIQEEMSESVDQALQNLSQSKQSLALNNNKVPKDLIKQNEQAQDVIGQLEVSLKATKDILDSGLPWLSAADGQPKKFMIVFQNNTEMRGSGGFIGSFAIADWRGGELRNLKFQTNIYKLDTAFTASTKVTPPSELVPFVGDHWALRDSNFALDFADSAAKMQEFYKLESGDETQGVIVLDTTLFLELLKVVGPIEMPKYDKIITDQNFLKDVQHEVEKGYFDREGGKEENEPKQILADMLPIFMSKLTDAFGDRDKSTQVLGAIATALKEKHLLFKFDNTDLEQMILKSNYGGTIEHSLKDYLYVSNTNIGGAKSSLNVKESLKHDVTIAPNGVVTSILNIERKHEGTGEWPDGTNKNLVRVLLPQDSKINNFSPIQGNFVTSMDNKFANDPVYKVDEESSKEKVSFWQNTKPGETTKSEIKYQSNYKVNINEPEFTYSLYVQKQPGSLGDNYELSIHYPAGFEPSNVKNYDPINHLIVLKYVLKTDKEFLIKFKKN